MSAEYVSFTDLQGAAKTDALRTLDVDIDRLGKVKVREVTAREVKRIAAVCSKLDAKTGEREFDEQKYKLCRIAASLVEPSLGSDLEKKVLASEQLSDLPAEVFMQLMNAVEQVCSGENVLGGVLGEIDKRISDLEAILLLAAEQGQWFPELAEVGISDIRTVANYVIGKRKMEAEQAAILSG